MWMSDKMILSKICSPGSYGLKHSILKILYTKNGKSNVFGNLITAYLVCSKKKLNGNQKKFTMVGTLFYSTNDPLLIHLLCSLGTFAQM